jgi:uncharacterized membrane protein YkgB
LPSVYKEVFWVGLTKFTAYEATGITPFVSHSQLMVWMLNLMSIRSVSDGLGIVEVTTAVLIASRRFSARAAQVGGFLAVATFLTTLTFLVSTPGAWAAPLRGFPELSGDVGQFLSKDIVLLGVSMWVLGEAYSALKCDSRSAV